MCGAARFGAPSPVPHLQPQCRQCRDRRSVLQRATAYPQQYQGNFFFNDYSGGFIKRIVFDADGEPQSVQPFATDVPAPVSMVVGPDGLIYYLSFTTGEIRRIRSNAPLAQATATPSYGLSPLTVDFSSAGSTNPGGGAITYLWNFGDGTTSTAANPSHTYTSASPVTLAPTLTVTNSAGHSASRTLSVTVGSMPPTPTIAAPVDGTAVSHGQTVNFHGSATDPEDGSLPASALGWTVLLHHNSHVHTFVSGTGSSGSFMAEDHGDIGTFAYEVVLTATDSTGLKSSTSVTLPVVADTVPPTDAGQPDRDRRRRDPRRPGLERGDGQRQRGRLPRRAMRR